LTTGQVNFCDATATYCTDIHLLGAAQLTSAGAATLKFRPGVGSHSYKAVFLGTPRGGSVYAGSASSASALTVTGPAQSSTTIAQSGNPGNYTLTATVGVPSTDTPTGTVSFLDTSYGNTVVGTAALGAGSTGLTFINSQTPLAGDDPWSVATGDFNGDGILISPLRIIRTAPSRYSLAMETGRLLKRQTVR